MSLYFFSDYLCDHFKSAKTRQIYSLTSRISLNNQQLPPHCKKNPHLILSTEIKSYFECSSLKLFVFTNTALNVMLAAARNWSSRNLVVLNFVEKWEYFLKKSIYYFLVEIVGLILFLILISVLGNICSGQKLVSL